MNQTPRTDEKKAQLADIFDGIDFDQERCGAAILRCLGIKDMRLAE